MYLHRILLDLNKRDTVFALGNPRLLHAAIEGSFVGERERKLWRLDSYQGKYYLLVLSNQASEFKPLVARYGVRDAAVERLDYARFLEKLEAGQTWKFRLVANPVQSSVKNTRTDGENIRGSVHAHVTIDQQKQWLLSRQESLGVRILQEQFDVTATNWYQFKKRDKNQVSLKVAAYEGVLEIENAELLKKVLVGGLGRAKAYGCGLLTLAPLR